MLLFASCYCENHDSQKQLGEERIQFSLSVIVHHQEKSGQEAKAETCKLEQKQKTCRNVLTG